MEADGSWREPTTSLHLRWGSYRGRYLAGILLIVAGGIALQGTNSYTPFLMLQGTLAHVAGWLVLPAGAARRLWVLAPCVAVIWVLVTGPLTLALLTIPFIAWLIVRQRPLISYLAVLPLGTVCMLLASTFHEYSAMPITLGIALATFAACAWLARLAAMPRQTSSHPAVGTE